VLVKGSDVERERAGSVLSLAANLVALLSVLVSPYMPELSETIEGQLNWKQSKHSLTNRFVCYLTEGHQIGEPKPLFQKIEPPMIAKLQAKLGGKQNRDSPPADQVNSVAAGKKSAEPVAVADAEEVARLTAECTAQGEVVRKLKAEKAEKSLIDAEVAKLVALKGQLASAQGVTVEPAAGSKQAKKKGKK